MLRLWALFVRCSPWEGKEIRDLYRRTQGWDRVSVLFWDWRNLSKFTQCGGWGGVGGAITEGELKTEKKRSNYRSDIQQSWGDTDQRHSSKRLEDKRWKGAERGHPVAEVLPCKIGKSRELILKLQYYLQNKKMRKPRPREVVICMIIQRVIVWFSQVSWLLAWSSFYSLEYTHLFWRHLHCLNICLKMGLFCTFLLKDDQARQASQNGRLCHLSPRTVSLPKARNGT